MITDFADLKPYLAMKPSGVEWLGEVPEHWELRRTKTLLRERSEKGFPDEPLLAATQTKGVVRKEQYEKRTVLALKDLHLLKLVRVSDFVISLRSFQGGIEYAREQGIISPAYTILYPVERDNHAYLAHVFKSKPYIENLSLSVTGIRQGQNIDYEKLSRSLLPYPSLAEQAIIVRYLDHADRRIRRYIRAKQKLITLLEEQKQALIHRAVTGQIDVRTGQPYPAYKPSGVEWLGEVPEHWEVVPLKRIAWFKSGAGFPVAEQGRQDSEIPFLKVSDMTRPGNEVWIEMTGSSVSSATATRLGAFVFPAGSIIFPKVGGALLTNKRRLLRRPSCVDNNVMGCVVSEADLNYAFILLQQLDLGRLAKPGPVPAIGEGEVRAIKVVLPPTQEQVELVTFVHRETANLDSVILTTKRETTLLREYRTRLIADVVTGKLDVRAAAARLPDEAEEPEPRDETNALTEGEEEPTDDLDTTPEEAAV